MIDYQSTARMQRPPRIPTVKHLDVADLERLLEQRRRTSTVLRAGNRAGKSSFDLSQIEVRLAAHMTVIGTEAFDKAFRGHVASARSKSWKPAPHYP